jgi:hypothetical protein
MQTEAFDAMNGNDIEKERIWNFYIELGLTERHFNTIQSSYRTLASTWLLAAFAGTGFVLSTDINLLVSQEIIVAGIGLGASVGIYILWLIDLRFYQKLLSAAFQEARILELDYPWLPQVHNNMREILKEKGSSIVGWFYIVAIEIMAFVGGVGVLLWFRENASAKFHAVVYIMPIIYFIGMVLVLWRMRREMPRPPLELERLKKAREQAESRRVDD